MDCDRGWYQRLVAGDAATGQSTVEYAIVAIGLFSAVVGIYALARAAFDGPIAGLVLDALSHRLPQGVLDVVLF